MHRIHNLILVIVLGLVVTSVAAEDAQPRQLDPAKPADAVVIVDQLTRQLTLPRDQAVALTMAIQTLGALASPPAASAVPASPAAASPAVPASTDGSAPSDKAPAGAP